MGGRDEDRFVAARDSERGVLRQLQRKRLFRFSVGASETAAAYDKCNGWALVYKCTAVDLR